MTANGSVTIYHFDEKSEEYKPTQYKSASIYNLNCVKNSGTTNTGNGGFSTANSCKIRIPTAKKIDISCNDYVYIGLSGGKIDKSKCLRVFAFVDNRRGGLKHWKIECR